MHLKGLPILWSLDSTDLGADMMKPRDPEILDFPRTITYVESNRCHIVLLKLLGSADIARRELLSRFGGR